MSTRLGLACLLTLVACSTAVPPRSTGPALPPTTTPSTPRPRAVSPFPCPASPAVIGHLFDPQLDEISGIVESRSQPGVFFVHNDSGESPRFFAIDLAGRVLAELSLPSVPILIDAEDIAAGLGPDGRGYLYLGDTGNNFSSMGLGIPRRKAVLYKLLEPHLPRAARAIEREVPNVAPIVFTFPDGARDVEAFFIDPRDGDLFMLTKESDGQSQLLTANTAMLLAGGGELREALTLRFGRAPLAGNPMPTAASITPDGSRILVRTYSSVFLFERGPGESIPAALSRRPLSLPPPKESQGEAISFANDGRAGVTISEGKHARIHCQTLPQNPQKPE